MGENPAVGSANAKLHRLGMANLQVAGGPRPAARSRRRRSGRTGRRSRPASCAPRTSGPRCSSCPPPRTPRRTAPSRTRSACCSGTTRRSSRRATARSELHFMYHLIRRIREKLAQLDGAAGPGAPGPDLGLPDRGPDTRSRTPRRCCARSPGSAVADGRGGVGLHRAEGRRLDGLRVLDLLRRATPDEVNQAARRRPGGEQTWVAPDWGWAWPMNRRILYNRASADPDGAPWSERKKLRLVGRRGRARGRATTCPTSRPTSRPDYVPPPDADGRGGAARGRAVHPAGRRQGLALRAERPARRAAARALRAARVAGPQPPAPRRAGQPDPPAVPAARQPVQPDRRRTRAPTCSRSRS